MNKKTILSVLLILLALPCVAAEKSDAIKPQWVNNIPQPTNSSFLYIRKTAKAKTLDQARQECLSSLLNDAGLSKGVSVTSDYLSTRDSKTTISNDNRQDNVSREFHVTTSVKGKEVEMQGRTVDEYWEKDDDGMYYLTTLFARSNLDQPARFDNVELTTKYGARGLWRSAIVPGWGQFYKGSNLKGGLILGGTVALAVGTIYTESQRSDYVSKIGKTHDVNIKKAYATKRDHFATGRNICIGALAALYVYNLVDAVVAPGARRVVVSKRENTSFSYMVAPTIMDDGSPAIAAAITF